MSAYEQPPLDLGAVCQRWKHRRHSWRPTSEGEFDPARYRVREMPNELVHRAKAFGPRTGRRLTATSYPYPKADQGGAAA
jgi:hypothetical protein